MNSIPPDIYKRVHELELAIVNAFEADNDALHDSLCRTLRGYFDEQTNLKRSHPFLTEATADFTDDPAEAVRLYELALEQAREFPDEPTHTKMISLAEHLFALDRRAEAEKYLRSGRDEAVRRGDKLWVKDANKLLRELTR